jgi:hypothetical protein
MAADYGDFANDSSTRNMGYRASRHRRGQLTPSFFCRLEDEVVYWNTSRFSG